MLLERIKERVKKFDLTLSDVAEKTGISPNTVYSWRKKTPRSDKLKQIAELLNTTTDYLNGLTDDPTIPNHRNTPTTFEDLGLPYKGVIPDDINDMYRAIAKQYAEKHNLPKRDA